MRFSHIVFVIFYNVKAQRYLINGNQDHIDTLFVTMRRHFSYYNDDNNGLFIDFAIVARPHAKNFKPLNKFRTRLRQCGTCVACPLRYSIDPKNLEEKTLSVFILNHAIMYTAAVIYMPVYSFYGIRTTYN